MLEGDALALACFLRAQGAADFEPVVYPKFGTAMVVVKGRDVEMVTARIESYAPDSRKPETVEPGSLADDARRRDFTINTLLQSLDTGAVTDPLGKAFADIDAQSNPHADRPQADVSGRPPADAAGCALCRPLSALQLSRFTWKAIRQSAPRLSIISAERIRDEFCKTLMTSRAPLGLELLQGSGLLRQFAPELVAMVWGHAETSSTLTPFGSIR